MTDRARYKAEHKAESRAEARDIGPIEEPLDPERKARAGKSLLYFLTTYLAGRFPLAFSKDHLDLIESLEGVIIHGGLRALAMPRGSGKTTITEGAALWAVLYAHRQFIMVVAADAGLSRQIYESIRGELEHNDLLHEDFPEATTPIRALEGIARRAEGQTSEGELTQLIWTKVEMRLGRMAAGGGSIMRATGITGQIRGSKAKLADGSQVRPDLVLVDDFQTDTSARSPAQVAARLRTIRSTILGLSGPGKKIACLCSCTIITKGDGADQLLDRKEHPEWQGTTARLMRSMPSKDATPLWDQYAEIFKADLTDDTVHQANKMTRATEFYLQHQAAMDQGADPSWPERKSAQELTAIQHAMNLYIQRGADAFAAEYQNSPPDPLADGDVVQLTPAAVLRKLNGHDRGLLPIDDSMLTAAIDVQGAALYWGICGWTPDFSGDLISYGTYPDQGRPYFKVTEIQKTMEIMHPGASWEASLYASLEILIEQILGKEIPRDDGTVGRVELVVIDASYGRSTDTVYKFCRQSRWSTSLIPYQGRGFAAGAVPIDSYKKNPGDRSGPGWRIAKPTKRQIRHVLADSNARKSFIADRILTPAGAGGCFQLYGRQASDHRMLADQLCAEVRTRVSANGRTSDEWRVKPNQDNHFLDVLSMAAIGASIRGVKLDEKAVSSSQRARQANAAWVAAQHPGAPAEFPTAPVPAPAPAPAPRPVSPPPPPRPPRPAGGGGWMAGFGFGGM